MGEIRWLNDREAHLWRSWMRVNADLTLALSQQLSRDSGLSAADYAVLAPLSESPGGVLRSRELRGMILWDRDRLSHQIRRMEGRGLVAREDCDDDARGTMVRLTPEGRAAIEGAAPGHVAAARQLFFDLVTEREIATLTKVFDRVLANLSDTCPTEHD